MYDGECPHALTCELSSEPFLGGLEVFRVSAAPVDDRSPSHREYLPTGCHIGGQRRKVEAETTTPLYSGSSAEQIYTDSDSECVSASSALPPSGNDSVRNLGLPGITAHTSSEIYEELLLEAKSAKYLASMRNNMGISGSYSFQLCPFRKCDKKITPIAHLENKHSDPSKGVSATFRGIQLAIAL